MLYICKPKQVPLRILTAFPLAVGLLFCHAVIILLFTLSVINVFYQAGTRTIDIELTTLSSTNHVELNPSDAGFQDRYIVQEIIKEMAKNRPIDPKGKKGFKGNFTRCIICFTLAENKRDF